jgi:hypothetical protein
MPTVRISIGCPPGFHEVVARMIHEHPPALSDGRTPSVRNVPPRGDASEFDLIYPDPKPTIPELIAKWHAEPTESNRLELWHALDANGGSRLSSGGSVYYAKTGDTFKHLEVF